MITGAPGTGKSTVIRELSQRNFECMPEISREVTLNARKSGTDQLFLTNPLLFSELLLEGRVNQYIEGELKNCDLLFFDRGIPDIPAYMDYVNMDYPSIFIEKSNFYRYNYIFLMPPWEEIYISDNERYENFDQAITIHDHLKNIYQSLNYKIIEVPFGSVNDRTNFIIDQLTK